MTMVNYRVDIDTRPENYSLDDLACDINAVSDRLNLGDLTLISIEDYVLTFTGE
jgi:hypothetical protein